LLRAGDRLGEHKPVQTQSAAGMPRAAWWSNLEDIVVASPDENWP
jgi:hypothetical protein